MHPSPKEKKKPKGFKPGSRRGQQKQLISDKIKQAREEGHAWLNHLAPRGVAQQGLWRLKIELPREDVDGVPGNIPQYCGRGPAWAFIRCKQGICFSVILDYKGERLVTWVGGGYRTLQFEDILGVVIEKHRVNQSDES